MFNNKLGTTTGFGTAASGGLFGANNQQKPASTGFGGLGSTTGFGAGANTSLFGKSGFGATGTLGTNFGAGTTGTGLFGGTTTGLGTGLTGGLGGQTGKYCSLMMYHNTLQGILSSSLLGGIIVGGIMARGRRVRNSISLSGLFSLDAGDPKTNTKFCSSKFKIVFNFGAFSRKKLMCNENC